MIQIAAPSRPVIGLAPASSTSGGVGDFARLLAGLPVAAAGSEQVASGPSATVAIVASGLVKAAPVWSLPVASGQSAGLAGKGLPLFSTSSPEPLPEDGGANPPSPLVAAASPIITEPPLPTDPKGATALPIPAKGAGMTRRPSHPVADVRFRFAAIKAPADTLAATPLTNDGVQEDQDAPSIPDASPDQPVRVEPTGTAPDPAPVAVVTTSRVRNEPDERPATLRPDPTADPIGVRLAGDADAQVTPRAIGDAGPVTTIAQQSAPVSRASTDPRSAPAAAVAPERSTGAMIAPAAVTPSLAPATPGAAVASATVGVATASPADLRGSVPPGAPSLTMAASAIATAPLTAAGPSAAEATSTAPAIIPAPAEAGAITPPLGRVVAAPPPALLSRQQQAVAPAASAVPAAVQSGSAAPAARVFADAITAVGRQDRVGAPPVASPARRAASVGATASALDGASLSGVLAAAGPHAVAAPTASEGATLDLADRHWPSAMVDHIERLRDEADAGSTRIRVVPDALGGIDVSLSRHHDGAVQVTLFADQPATRVLLADAQPELNRLAEARGIRLAEPGVSGGATGGFAGSGNGQAADGQPRRPAPTLRAAPTPSFTDDSDEAAAGRIA